MTWAIKVVHGNLVENDEFTDQVAYPPISLYSVDRGSNDPGKADLLLTQDDARAIGEELLRLADKPLKGEL
jgi:hypothetical protein